MWNGGKGTSFFQARRKSLRRLLGWGGKGLPTGNCRKAERLCPEIGKKVESATRFFIEYILNVTCTSATGTWPGPHTSLLKGVCSPQTVTITEGNTTSTILAISQ